MLQDDSNDWPRRWNDIGLSYLERACRALALEFYRPPGPLNPDLDKRRIQTEYVYEQVEKHWPRFRMKASFVLRAARLPNLFQLGNFILASGNKSNWKIECDAITDRDWPTLAKMASEILEPFGKVEGVPNGGLPFAEALAIYATPDCQTLLIAEDVVTTGGSMERHRNGREAIGVSVFSRGDHPKWVTPIFVMSKPRRL